MQLCEDIRDALLNAGICLNDYEVVQVKEKFGSLRWYDMNGNSSIDEIIQKYEYLSAHVCIHCGKIDVPLYGGWISPFCDVCADEFCIKDAQIREANLQNTFNQSQFHHGQIIEKTIDISDILEKIGYKKDK